MSEWLIQSSAVPNYEFVVIDLKKKKERPQNFIHMTDFLISLKNFYI